jgi:hypothetical protein
MSRMNVRFSRCDGETQRLKPFNRSLTSAASLKRSPDTNRFSQTAPLPKQT